MDTERHEVILATVWHRDVTVRRAFWHEVDAFDWVDLRKTIKPVVQWQHERLWLVGNPDRRPR